MIKRILIANRGEIACRIARTCRKLGIDAVGVYSSADNQSRHVREIGHTIAIGGANASQSYLDIEKLIGAAKNSGCDAVHPGYGFLSENPDFADAVEAAGLTFIGSRADSLRRFGDKSAAKNEAIKAAIPVIPGSDGKLSDPVAIADVVKGMELPVMLKAAAGGGGKGMRIISDWSNLEPDISAAMSEALRAFSDEALLVEQCIHHARHVEVQIAGDGEGGIVHLFERECSLQRRHQKVVEEAPAVFLKPALREKLLADACRLGQQINYRGLGTVEFLVQDDNYYFLEVNPRLQVEHPVTEMITGLDLVELQISIAQGTGFGFQQEGIHATGHAIEVRLYAETPEQNFMPATGTIEFLEFPGEHLRVETGVDTGDEVGSYYDPMIAKLIASGDNRGQALERLQKGIDETVLFGVDNNRNFLQQLLRQEDVVTNNIDTGMLDRWLTTYSDAAAQQPDQQAAIAAVLWLYQYRKSGSTNPWERADVFSCWAMRSPQDSPVYTFSLMQNEVEWKIAFLNINEQGLVSLMVNDQRFDLHLLVQGDFRWIAAFAEEQFPVVALVAPERLCLHALSQQNSYQIVQVVRDKQGEAGVEDSVMAPMMGEVIKLVAREGDSVEEGDLLIVMESMKMQLQIAAVKAGIVTNIYCQVGDNVARGEVVVEVNAE